MPVTNVKSLWEHSICVVGKHNQCYILSSLLNEPSQAFFWALYKCEHKYEHNLIRHCYYSHCTVEETEAQRLNDFPRSLSSEVVEPDSNPVPKGHVLTRQLKASHISVLSADCLEISRQHLVPFSIKICKVRHTSLTSAQRAIIIIRPLLLSPALLTFWTRSFFVTGCPVHCRTFIRQPPGLYSTRRASLHPLSRQPNVTGRPRWGRRDPPSPPPLRPLVNPRTISS